MTHVRPNETEEWLVAKIEQWVETYKKSMLTPVILGIVAARSQVTVAEVAAELNGRIGWTVTERGLYRTIRRLEHDGFLAAAEVAAARTGKKKKVLSVTEMGKIFLKEVMRSLVEP